MKREPWRRELILSGNLASLAWTSGSFLVDLFGGSGPAADALDGEFECGSEGREGQRFTRFAGRSVGQIGSSASDWLQSMIQNGSARALSDFSQSIGRELVWAYYNSGTDVVMSAAVVQQPTRGDMREAMRAAPPNVTFVGFGHTHGAGLRASPYFGGGPSTDDNNMPLQQVLIDRSLRTFYRNDGQTGSMQWERGPIISGGLRCAGVND